MPRATAKSDRSTGRKQEANDLPAWADAAIASFGITIGAPFDADREQLDATEAQALLLAQERLATIRARLSRGWTYLDTDSWQIKVRNRSLVSGNILECAVEVAFDLASGRNHEQVASALRHLTNLNDEITSLAGQLAELFEKRRKWVETYGLYDAPKYGADPMELSGALKCAVSEEPALRSWARQNEQAATEFLRVADGNSARPGPRWENVLGQLSARAGRESWPRNSMDVAAMRKTNSSHWSPWCNALIDSLGNWPIGHGPSTHLDCLSADQLACLAEVVFDAEAGVINASQIAKLTARWRKSQA